MPRVAADIYSCDVEWHIGIQQTTLLGQTHEEDSKGHAGKVQGGMCQNLRNMKARLLQVADYETEFWNISEATSIQIFGVFLPVSPLCGLHMFPSDTYLHKTFFCQVQFMNCNFGNSPGNLRIVYASVCYNTGLAICPNTSASSMALFGDEPQDGRGGSSHRAITKSVQRQITALLYTVQT